MGPGREIDIRVRGVALYALPVETRVPLKFGSEVLTTVTCARVRITVEDRSGKRACGWGETPLSVQWGWPSTEPFEPRHRRMKQLCRDLAARWREFDAWGHPIEIGHAFMTQALPSVLEAANEAAPGQAAMPWLAALISSSPFDLALHDAYGELHRVPTYETYCEAWMNRDLSDYLEPESGVSFRERYPKHYLCPAPAITLPAWHLVGGLDPIRGEEMTGAEPEDGYPVLLRDWIERDRLKCLKIKLRGTDEEWDYARIVGVGSIAIAEEVDWLSVDFNCTVTEPDYVNGILDRLLKDEPRIFSRILYVEQPFPYDLEAWHLDVHSVSARKPLFMDESAHNWRLVRCGRGRGWSGVALKTCKTQTEAILTLCWARAHGMSLMVQDLTNPMLAQVPHALLAAHAGTLMGVETNAMQFYPDASRAEEKVHPGLYRRRNGRIDLTSLGNTGFGYRVSEIQRVLPSPEVEL